MNINWETGLYCLIGNPINKSLSPDIHNYFFKINNLNDIYLSFNVEEQNLENLIMGLKSLNVKGFNVTIPHKIEIINYMDEITKEAKLLGAVNTVINADGKLIGDNTDGKGFIKSLKDEKVKVEEKEVLIIGAGGAAHAISISLAINGVKKITILNRKKEKAKILKKKINENFKDVIVNYDSITDFHTDVFNSDIVINCTSVGMYPNIEKTLVGLKNFKSKTVVCDIVYKPLKTKFLEIAEKDGLKTVNGIGMLVNQAVLSQKVWNNISEKNVEKCSEEIKGFLLNK
ncbi:MAG TPA: shikimate dehydrogenase [Tissierellales bacterium]|nr:shikimate dehydrogenase [Tissierellales bacterium]